jgi:uroporphyrin-III C-methyltransferase
MNDPREDEPRDADDPPIDSPDSPTASQYPPTPPPSSTGRSLGIVLGFFALLVAFAAAGGAAFTWWQLKEQRAVVVGEQAVVDDELAEMRRLVTAAEERLVAQEERLRALDSEAADRRRRIEDLDAELRQARARLESLSQEEAAPGHSPSVAEVEFLLLLAGRELALADNPRVALAALREADQRVARLEDPGLAQVRAAINDEITAVEAVATIDLEGTALRLSSLARRVEGLPLRASLAPDPAPAATPEDAAAGWDRFTGRLRAFASGLFRIRRTDSPATPLLAPEESFFLYRNVELDLKSARLAVLSRDPGNYAAGLEAARRALEQYFETSDESVGSMLEAIAALEELEIAPAWPPIRRSLELLRAAGASE